MHASSTPDLEAMAARWLGKGLPRETRPQPSKKKRGNNKMEVKLLYKVGSRGTGEGQFDFPTHVAFLPDGGFIVSDKNNYRLQIFDSCGRFKRSFLNNQVNFNERILCKA